VKPLRLGIESRLALAHPPGIGRYVRELLRALAEIEDGERGVALTRVDVGFEPPILRESALGAAARSRRLRLPLPRSLAVGIGRAGFQVDRLAGGLDFLHHVRAPLLPRSRARRSLALSELPADPGARDALGVAARGADLVFVFSSAAAHAFAPALALDPARLRVVPVGADHWSREIDVLPAVRDAPRDRPRILVLGAQRREREPLALLAALEAIARGGLRFEVVYAGRTRGADPGFLARVPDSSIREFVRFVEPTEAELPALVAGSSLLVHLAKEEWTPVTPLEAMAAGCAVVASRLPAFEEALGAAAVFVAPEEIAAPPVLAAHIVRAIATEPAARAARRALASRFTWAASAGAHLAEWRASERRDPQP
jgi:glycosyltransferase involved in cell wall biosynthesis